MAVPREKRVVASTVEAEVRRLLSEGGRETPPQTKPPSRDHHPVPTPDGGQSIRRARTGTLLEVEQGIEADHGTSRAQHLLRMVGSGGEVEVPSPGHLHFVL